jgi:hypothetical protein
MLSIRQMTEDVEITLQLKKSLTESVSEQQIELSLANVSTRTRYQPKIGSPSVINLTFSILGILVGSATCILGVLFWCKVLEI